ncbi:MAG TPA: MltA domain-containing protein [Pedomonas sp.]|uniref:murein transglycosylase A n=1 Tax=Pedomonas sp. TaxID=2976421 RepID=UPI002F4146AF
MTRAAFRTAIAVSVSLSVLAACTPARKEPVAPTPPSQPVPSPAPVPSQPAPEPVLPVPTPGPAPVQPPVPAPLPEDVISAAQLPRTAGPAVSQLPGWQQSDPLPALHAFRRSCRSLERRQDVSGLTRPGDWTAICASVQSVGNTTAEARRFFETHFATLRVGEGATAGVGLNTGYYEPELAGARSWSMEYSVPLYRRPPELVDVDLGIFRENLRGQRIAGRIEGNKLVPYADRGQIEEGALQNRGLELAWVRDPYEAFFLHIQGSGRVRLPDGSIMRVGYDGQNGHQYQGMGRLLLDRGLLAPGQATMQGIIAWARANPEKARQIMRENRSFVFFRELTGEGPLGAMGHALTPYTSVASDPRFVPLGVPLWLETAYPNPQDRRQHFPLSRLMVAQDTGGAIKGPNRLDLFWGAGETAAMIAGGLSWRGVTTLLLPRPTVQRLLATKPGLLVSTPPAGSPAKTAKSSS